MKISDNQKIITSYTYLIRNQNEDNDINVSHLRITDTKSIEQTTSTLENTKYKKQDQFQNNLHVITCTYNIM